MRVFATVVAIMAALLLPAAASAKRAEVTVRTVPVADAGNPSTAIVPFTDAIYASCADAPAGSDDCIDVGGVDYDYEIGELEVTVEQWVGFLNTVDPEGRNPHKLYEPTQSANRWPRFGAINRDSSAPDGEHYSIAYPEWADKPYAYATFLRAARFVNSLYNGRVITEELSTDGPVPVMTYRVRLARQTERGMYDMAQNKKGGATRAHEEGFVIPSQDEWIKAAYWDQASGAYWKYPTNPGTFGTGGPPSASTQADAPNQTILDPTTGNVTNSSTQPLATFHESGETAPNWCPSQVSSTDCTTVNPFGIDATTYQELFQGSVGTVGQAGTRSPSGTLDQGGNVVEWTDTITASPFGNTKGRVWRRLHGGISNAPAYQLWLSAVGLQPQSNPFYGTTYPWLGFRIGVIGDLGPGR